LESLGYHVLTADNGQQAITTYIEHQSSIDLLLMDVVMPVMNGDEAAAAIRSINPDVRIIFATGYAQPGNLTGSVNLKSETVISKPFSTGEVSQLIRKVLDQNA